MHTNLAAYFIQHIGAYATVVARTQFFGSDQVNGNRINSKGDVGVFHDLGCQALEDGFARGIGSMDNAAVTMTAFLAQMIVLAGITFLLQVNFTPCSTSHSMHSRPRDTVYSTISLSHKPSPAAKVSSTWES